MQEQRTPPRRKRAASSLQRLKTRAWEQRDEETLRLKQCHTKEKKWKRWGPYLSDRQWATVREDYSSNGDAWSFLPHDHARSKAYRWGEDGLLGITDKQCRLCFAIGLWNEEDPILKERLFGLTGYQGNHGEDVKEEYFHLCSTPTHSYMKALYKYPQSEYPYQRLVDENARRSRQDPEFELVDTGIFDEDKYFDVFVEYAKQEPNDILIRIKAINRGPETANLHLLPTFWFRNTWSWGNMYEGTWQKPDIRKDPARPNRLIARHATLEPFCIEVESLPIAEDGVYEHEKAARNLYKCMTKEPEWLFTENETNREQLHGDKSSERAYYKDAFHDYVIHDKKHAVCPDGKGTKAAAHHAFAIPSQQSVTLKLRMYSAASDVAFSQISKFGGVFDETFRKRVREKNTFYRNKVPVGLTDEERNVAVQAYSGLLWSKQFYHYIVRVWLDGDPGQPPPPLERKRGRNREWPQLFARDVVLMPDKWEYPWFAVWDLAFHCVAISKIDVEFAKQQLLLMLREWYMHPNGCLPAYEYNFSDVNPPVHAWASWRVYKASGPPGQRDTKWLGRVFQKLLINFTWWVNRKDVSGKHIFSGGFLGLDNIGVFDRSQPLPGGYLEQADGTAWMAFYSLLMLKIALELSRFDPVYEDVASKFFEHFVSIVDAINSFGESGLWDNTDGFYYDQVRLGEHHSIPLRVRSLVGLVPLFAVGNILSSFSKELPGFSKRIKWFMNNRQDLAKQISFLEVENLEQHRRKSISKEMLGLEAYLREKELNDRGEDTEEERKLLRRLQEEEEQVWKLEEERNEYKIRTWWDKKWNGREPDLLLQLAIPSKEKLQRMLQYLLSEEEFLSKYGIRSMSRYYHEHPFHIELGGQTYSLRYTPGESDVPLFGGNSNWRGPIWIPMNFLLIEALERYYNFYGDSLMVEFPTGSGNTMDLAEVADQLSIRLVSLFLPEGAMDDLGAERQKDDSSEDVQPESPRRGSSANALEKDELLDDRDAVGDIIDPLPTTPRGAAPRINLPGGRRPCHGQNALFAQREEWRELIYFYEYFDGDTGKGLGASHQTGWTALVALLLERVAKCRATAQTRRKWKRRRSSISLSASGVAQLLAAASAQRGEAVQ